MHFSGEASIQHLLEIQMTQVALLQVIMWQVFMSRTPFIENAPGVQQDPSFPGFPAVCPFNYAVLAMACMAANPEDRPPVYQAYEVLTSLEVDLAAGTYFDWTGTQRVRPRLLSCPAMNINCV